MTGSSSFGGDTALDSFFIARAERGADVLLIERKQEMEKGTRLFQ